MSAVPTPLCFGSLELKSQHPHLALFSHLASPQNSDQPEFLGPLVVGMGRAYFLPWSGVKGSYAKGKFTLGGASLPVTPIPL